MRSYKKLCRREIAIPQPLYDWIRLNNGSSKFSSVDRKAKAKPILTSMGSDVNGAAQPGDPNAFMTAISRTTHIILGHRHILIFKEIISYSKY